MTRRSQTKRKTNRKTNRKKTSDGAAKVEDNLFYLIFRQVPTWAAAVIVAASYPVLRWLLPFLTHGNLSALALSAFAPWLTLALVLIALYAEGDKFRRRRLLSQQSSLGTLRNMTWQEFEHLVGEVYRRQGYKVEEKGGSGPDGGIDIVLQRDGETVLVQCKQWKTQSVGVRPLRELRGVTANEKAARGIFVTCGGYTQAALAEAGGLPPLELIDGPKLLKLVQEMQAKGIETQAEVSNAPAAVSTVQAVDEAAEPVCPKCGSAMNRKTARRGMNIGNNFWGCSQFPQCRETRPL